MQPIDARTLTPFQKSKILDRDDHCCAYCYGPADQVDHVMPWAYAHDNNPENLVAACWLCNLIGSDFVFETFYRKRAFIQAKRYRYIKNHSIPLWTKDEVSKLGYVLRIYLKDTAVICEDDEELHRVSYRLLREGWRIVTGSHRPTKAVAEVPVVKVCRRCGGPTKGGRWYCCTTCKRSAMRAAYANRKQSEACEVGNTDDQKSMSVSN